MSISTVKNLFFDIKNAEKSNGGFYLKRPLLKGAFSLFNFLIRLGLLFCGSLCVAVCVLSSLGVPYGLKSLALAVGVASVVFGVLSLSIFTRVIMYAVMFVFSYTAFTEYRQILKPGLMYIGNFVYEAIRADLNLPVVDGFDAGAGGSGMAEVMILYCAVLLTMVLAVVIVRYCSVLCYLVAVVGAGGISSYFGTNVDHRAAVGCVCVLFAMFFIKLSGITGARLGKGMKYKNASFAYTRSDGLYMLFCVLTAVFIGSLGLHFGSGLAYKGEETKFAKESKYFLRDTASRLLLRYKHNILLDGVNAGQLGFLGDIKPSFGAVFEVETVPIEEGKLFLKNYTGSTYEYRSNSWKQTDYKNETEFAAQAESLKNDGEKHEIDIKLVGTGIKQELPLPYYTPLSENPDITYVDDNNLSHTLEKEEKETVVYYTGEPKVETSPEYNELLQTVYLAIDKENKEVIDKLLAENDITAENIDEKLADFFADNYTYDLQDGDVPFGKDFVNYFLTESKMGGYAHFASAAVLMYRSVGIPARYTGGYAVEAEKLAATYDLKSERSKTGVSRAEYYSWVEVYDEQKGWQVRDVSPAPSLAELKESYSDNKEEQEAQKSVSDVATDIKNYSDELADKGISYAEGLKEKAKIVAVVFAVLAMIAVIIGLNKRKVARAIAFVFSGNEKRAEIIRTTVAEKLRVSRAATNDELSEAASDKELAVRFCGLFDRMLYSKEKASLTSVKELAELAVKIKRRKDV